MGNPNYQPKNEPVAEDPELQEKVSYHNLSEPYVKSEHEWVQQGPELICRSCPAHHGIRIGVSKRLKGFDKEGNMLIENV